MTNLASLNKAINQHDVNIRLLSENEFETLNTSGSVSIQKEGEFPSHSYAFEVENGHRVGLTVVETSRFNPEQNPIIHEVRI